MSDHCFLKKLFETFSAGLNTNVSLNEASRVYITQNSEEGELRQIISVAQPAKVTIPPNIRNSKNSEQAEWAVFEIVHGSSKRVTVIGL